MRILVIEDDLRLARQVTRELQRLNHEVSARNDGAEGLEAALLNPPDLIVLDLNLPSLDGFSDQSHFNREFRHFMGVAPGAKLAGRMAQGMKVADHLIQAL